MIECNVKFLRMVSLKLKRMIEGKNWIERPRQSFKMQIMRNTGCKQHSEVNRLAQDGEK